MEKVHCSFLFSVIVKKSAIECNDTLLMHCTGMIVVLMGERCEHHQRWCEIPMTG